MPNKVTAVVLGFASERDSPPEEKGNYSQGREPRRNLKSQCGREERV